MDSSSLDILKKLTKNLNLKDKELKDRAETLNLIIETTTDGYWDWHIGSGKDGEEDYEYLSPKFKKQLGYEDHELENKPSSWQNRVYMEDLENMGKELELHFNSKGERPFECVCKYTTKQGILVYMLCRGNVVEWNEDGSPKRMIGTHTDVTTIYQMK